MKGEVNWAPVIKQYMYNIKLDDIKINGKAMNLCSDKDKPAKVYCNLAIDSGSPNDFIPIWAGKIFEREGVPTAGKGVDCPNGISDIGTFTFVIGGKDYTYGPEDWL